MNSDRRPKILLHFLRVTTCALVFAAALLHPSVVRAHTEASQFVPASSAADTIVSSQDKKASRLEVPEPASMLLFGSGLLGLGVVFRRRLARRD